MRFRDKRPFGYSAVLGVSALASIPVTTLAQELEEMVVTATRRETSLQDTPLSIQAFDAEDLELGGITNGRDLGIMVPNVVLNPNTGGAQANFYARGLPGVGLYVDGVWQDGFGFQQMNFAEMERVEVLRGPQGTLFGRNTNAGAVNMTTRRPADEFGARVRLDVGDYGRRDAQVAVDLPVTDTFKTKFMGAMYENDGFLEGLTVPWDFGAQDDTILRADLLWEPTSRFSLRFTHNDETKRGTDPKIHRMTRYDNSKIYAYNIMVGEFQAEANAACQANLAACQAIANGGALVGQTAFFTGTGWAPPPQTGFGSRYTGVASPAFNYATHTTNYGGGLSSAYGNIDANGVYSPNPLVPDVVFGPGQVGKWQTKSDSMEDGITADLEYTTLNARWDITDNLNFEAILSTWEQDQRQVIDFDGTEFLVTTDDLVQFRENETIELHLSGTAFNGRLDWLAGYYSLEEDLRFRMYRWGMWEFLVANTGPGPAAVNTLTSEYVRQTATLLGLNGTTIPGVPSGGNMLTLPATPVYGPAGPAGPSLRYPWNFGFISVDNLSHAFDDDEAFFGEVTFGLTEKIDLTFGARFSDKTGGDLTMAPSDAFRTPDPAIRPQGDPLVGTVTSVYNDVDQPTIETYKFSVAYRPTDAMMLYATYAEGFTAASEPLTTIGATPVVPPTCTPPKVSPTQVRCPVPAEFVDNLEIGLRSDWLNGQLRFNATYFDADWDGMRVWQLPRDLAGNTQPFPYQTGEGIGTADGLELEVVWLATERLQLNFGLGLIDTNYIASGLFDGVTGNRPDTPFAYAAEESGTVGANYEIPLGNGGHILLVGNYGYMGDYARDSAYQRTHIDANGNPILEPGYGILNARFVYEPADRNFSLELWGKNLTDELYINGGFDARDIWGYDFSIVGRSREVGASISFTF
jgi:outer membrane receptor protein involved in Fe transport